MTSRRELLLESAADLFAARGFHAVGIDDIGERAGITGPGVYRHFSSKQALLETLVDRALDRMLDLAEHAPDLDTLVDLHAAFVSDEQALVSVWVREHRSLTGEVAKSLRARMRRYEQVWEQAVAPHRPELGTDELGLLTRSVLAMLNTTSLIDSKLPTSERRLVLGRLARAALQA